jgi:peroxiredoxin
MQRNYLFLVLILVLNSVHGQQAVDFTITDTKGESWNLYDELAKGKTVVLDFFFVDCTPCQKFTPALARFNSTYDGDSVLILGISDRDKNTKVEGFETQFGVNYPSAGSEGGGDSVTRLYKSWFQFIGWPTYAVVCPNRTVYWNLERDTNFVEVAQKIQECSGTLSFKTAYKSIVGTYPNPTASNSSITLELPTKNPYSVKVTSAMGQDILSQEELQSPVLKIPYCENGVYLLEITQQNTVYQSKLLIQNN